MQTIHFSHANGFPSRAYNYLFSELSPHQVSYSNQLGHGPHKVEKGWEPLILELMQDIERTHNQPVVGMGHSLGAALTYLIAQRKPQLFSKIILLDPPLFSLLKRIPLFVATKLGLSDRLIGPARRSLKRRIHFGSREEAVAYFKQKALFKNFHPQCLADYVRFGTHQRGNAFELTFSPEVEYQIFRFTPYNIGRRHIAVPCYLVYSDQYEVLQRRDLQWLKRHTNIEGMLPFSGGHMYPFEHPEKLAKLIKELL